MIVPVLWLAACGLFEPKPDPVAQLELLMLKTPEPAALAVPMGAKVEVSEQKLRVDAADGSMWFDVNWIDTPRFPRLAAQAWGDAMCEAVRWDVPAEPTPRTWTSGGLCTIRNNRHWVLLLQEQHGDRTLQVGLVAPLRAMPWEDAWLLFLGSAASVSQGLPWNPGEVDALRARVRAVENPGGPSELPVPGGGTFSQRVSEDFAPLWAERLETVVPPRTFAVGEGLEHGTAPESVQR